MRNKFYSLSLFSKLVILTFLVTFSVVFATGGISLHLQTNYMKSQIVDTLTGLSSLWSKTIDGDEVKRLSSIENEADKSFLEIREHLSLITEKKSQFYHAYIVKPELNNDEIEVVISSSACDELQIYSYGTISPPLKFNVAFLEVLKTKETSVSELYKDEDKKWMSSFTPIFTANDEMAGIFVVTADASMIDSFLYEIITYFSIVFMIIVILVYFFFNSALKRVLKPVDQLFHGLKEVSYGNFKIKLPVTDQSDLGLLTKRFNEMTEQLSILFKRLSDTSHTLGKAGNELQRNTVFEEAIGEMEHIMERTKLLKKLQRAEKMNAIGQLAASVAHEIRNPMTVVKGFLQIFQVKEELSEEERTFVKLMIEEMDRAETIINDYLSLAKPDLEHTEEVDAEQLASKTMDLMNTYAKMSKNIELHTYIDDDVTVLGNRSELNQVLINVLKNGIEAMKDGGQLTMRVYRSNSYGVFEITDTGIGMSKEQLERLGTAFYSLKEKGTGIGLMVCYQIIERMKGRIEVESELGKGTTFKIYVPLYEQES